MANPFQDAINRDAAKKRKKKVNRKWRIVVKAPGTTTWMAVLKEGGDKGRAKKNFQWKDHYTDPDHSPLMVFDTEEDAEEYLDDNYRAKGYKGYSEVL